MFSISIYCILQILLILFNILYLFIESLIELFYSFLQPSDYPYAHYFKFNMLISVSFSYFHDAFSYSFFWSIFLWVPILLEFLYFFLWRGKMTTSSEAEGLVYDFPYTDCVSRDVAVYASDSFKLWLFFRKNKYKIIAIKEQKNKKRKMKEKEIKKIGKNKINKRQILKSNNNNELHFKIKIKQTNQQNTKPGLVLCAPAPQGGWCGLVVPGLAEV